MKRRQLLEKAGTGLLAATTLGASVAGATAGQLLVEAHPEWTGAAKQRKEGSMRRGGQVLPREPGEGEERTENGWFHPLGPRERVSRELALTPIGAPPWYRVRVDNVLWPGGWGVAGVSTTASSRVTAAGEEHEGTNLILYLRGEPLWQEWHAGLVAPGVVFRELTIGEPLVRMGFEVAGEQGSLVWENGSRVIGRALPRVGGANAPFLISPAAKGLTVPWPEGADERLMENLLARTTAAQALGGMCWFSPAREER